MTGTSDPLRFALAKIPVTDIARAAAFYREALGLAQEFVVEDYGWAQFSADGVPIALYAAGKGGGDGVPGGDTGLHFAVRALDDLAMRIVCHGTGSAGDIQAGADGTRFLDVTDPDGNTVRVFRAAD